METESDLSSSPSTTVSIHGNQISNHQEQEDKEQTRISSRRRLPLYEIRKWPTLYFLEDKYLNNLRLLFTHRETAFLVTEDDEFYSVGRNHCGSFGTGSDVPFFTKVPVRVATLDGKGVKDIKVAVQRDKNDDRFTAFALTDKGELYGWGWRGSGLLGAGHGASRRSLSGLPSLIRFAGDYDHAGKVVKEMAVGGGHILVLTDEGNVFAWGKNSSGQVSHNFKTNHDIPIAVKISDKHGRPVRIKAISAGENHSVALSSDGKVYTWGCNEKSQLGDGSKDHERILPKRIKFKCSTTSADNKTDSNSDSAEKEEEDEPQPARKKSKISKKKKKIKKISCGKYHTLALSEDGVLFSWGSNHHGNLGIPKEENGKSKHRSRVPVQVDSLKEDVLDIAAIASLPTSFCVTSEGVYMWGKLPEICGRDVDLPWKTLFTRIDDAISSFIVPSLMEKPLSISSKATTICQVSGEDATDSAQMAATTTMTIPVNGETDISEIPPSSSFGSVAARIYPELMKWNSLKCLDSDLLSKTKVAFVCGSGFEQTVIIVTADDDVFFLGKNVHGSMGNGDATVFETRTPLPCPALSKKRIVHFDFGLDVEGGCMCLFALTQEGKIYSWGYNDFGEMGTGEKSLDPQPPLQVGKDLAGVRFTNIACGSDHILALSESGDVYSWGYNMYGQLGTGEMEDHCAEPRRVVFLHRRVIATSIAAGMFHSAAVSESGEVFVWGQNDKDQLGCHFKEPYSATPIKLRIPLPVKKVTCGAYSTICLSGNGIPYLFGEFGEERDVLQSKLGKLGSWEEIVTTHWAPVTAGKLELGKIFMWGTSRGEGKWVGVKEVPNAGSVDDVFATLCNPTCMVRPVIVGMK